LKLLKEITVVIFGIIRGFLLWQVLKVIKIVILVDLEFRLLDVDG